ncbi:unnamed protein product, partial [Ectocarpus fasciculatus]
TQHPLGRFSKLDFSTTKTEQYVCIRRALDAILPTPPGAFEHCYMHSSSCFSAPYTHTCTLFSIKRRPDVGGTPPTTPLSSRASTLWLCMIVNRLHTDISCHWSVKQIDQVCLTPRIHAYMHQVVLSSVTYYGNTEHNRYLIKNTASVPLIDSACNYRMAKGKHDNVIATLHSPLLINGSSYFNSLRRRYPEDTTLKILKTTHYISPTTLGHPHRFPSHFHYQTNQGFLRRKYWWRRLC